MRQSKSSEAKQLWDENDMLQEDADLNILRDMISPYWSSRVVVQPETRKPLVVIDGLHKKELQKKERKAV